ncbi:Crp/Fnr family transcriptional regulator [Glycomyces dulcitolivorans]|jgi:CRP-like cAMP-binding protein|uniref:Crp/Fnr family transcriptional regulator n=1 Tax=Glycomyces dulcitolivorans TaxID=2200759 RepID=UPI000DD3D9CD|nr:Crp/Fnr family transcriptional regulator [Glycomyces dulcitolivorans]
MKMKWSTDHVREPLLTEAEYDTLGSGVHRVSYPKGSLLVLFGDHTDFVLYLIDGYVKSVQRDPDCILGIHSPGRFIGELAALTSKPRSADLVTLTEITALFIPGDTFLKLVTGNTQLAAAMMRQLGERVQDLGIRVKSIINAEQQLARAVLEIVHSGIGEERPDGLELIGFNQRDLASLSGISRESVSAILKPLKESGAVTIGRGRITIHDLTPFEVIAQRVDHALLPGRAT